MSKQVCYDCSQQAISYCKHLVASLNIMHVQLRDY